MKTMPREEFFEYMKGLLAYYLSTGKPAESLASTIQTLEKKDFDEIEIIPPQTAFDTWTFHPIFLNN